VEVERGKGRGEAKRGRGDCKGRGEEKEREGKRRVEGERVRGEWKRRGGEGFGFRSSYK
jgi:hypothetical protein